MKPTIRGITFLLMFMWVFQACLNDRMAPEPVPINRPEFLGFAEIDSGGVNLPLDHPVTMIFDEKMNINTFPDNFQLASISGEIDGTFSLDPAADSVVIFTTLDAMNPAEVYTAKVFGGVRDIYGNSRLSPNEENIPEITWIFTTGQYATNGFPHVFFVEKDGQTLLLVEQMNKYKSSTTITDEPTSGSGEMRITPDGSKIVIANRLAAGTISIFDPETSEEITTVSVGVGPEDIFLTDNIAYVVNLSGRTISVVDLSSYVEVSVIEFPDGFRPRDIVYSAKTNRLYVSSNRNGEYGKLRIIDAGDYENYYDIEDNWANNKKTVDMEISSDGEYIFIAEFNSTLLHVYSTTVDSVIQTIDHGMTKNEDGAISDHFHYLVTNDGSVFKTDFATQTVVAQWQLEKVSQAIDVTAADELLYVITPNDSTAQIIETSTMTRIGEVKVPGDLRRVAISVHNYQ